MLHRTAPLLPGSRRRRTEKQTKGVALDLPEPAVDMVRVPPPTSTGFPYATSTVADGEGSSGGPQIPRGGPW